MNMKDSLNRFQHTGVVPVVVLDNAKDAIPTARALLAGGVDVMEITFRTAAAADSIKAVSENSPDMLVGAGTVVTLDQCKQALECGAKFIVSPGFDPEVVSWCVERNVPITPGCVTPTEIMAAMKLGLNVVKFFPAGVYGGLKAMKSLSAPFGGVKFIPTGGVDAKNLKEHPNVFFAGQITGFEGYMESAASGLLAARNLYARLQGRELPPPPTTTMCGALIDYITTPNKDFQPMGANMGILPRTEEIDTIRDKRERYMALSDAAQAAMRAWAAEAEH